MSKVHKCAVALVCFCVIEKVKQNAELRRLYLLQEENKWAEGILEVFYTQLEGMSRLCYSKIITSKSKKKRGTWTQNDLKAAVAAIRNNKLSSYKAAITYKIPRRTLREYLKNGMSKRNLGRRSMLSTEQEQDLADTIIRLADLGTPLTAKMICEQAFVFCEKHNITNNFNKKSGAAGKDWLRLFLKRNSIVAERKAQFLKQAISRTLK